MKNIQFFIPALAIVWVAGCSTEKTDFEREFGVGVPPQVIEAVALTSPLQIDGKLTEPSWTQAPINTLKAPARRVVPMPPKTRAKIKAVEKSEVKILYDQENLYVGGKLYDSDICQNCQENQHHAYRHGDTFEIFIKAGGQPQFCEFYVMPNGLTTTFFFDYFGFPNPVRHHWTPEFQVAVRVKGSCNVRNDSDQYWSFEAVIPLRLLEAHLRQKCGQSSAWEILLSRYNFNSTLSRPEISSCPRFPYDKFADVEYFGHLKFRKR